MAEDTKIHVNKKTGKSGTCSARIKCPLGDDAPHFSTQAEANAYITALESENNDTFTTVSKGRGGKGKNTYQGPTSQQLLDRQRLRADIPERELTQAMTMRQYNDTVRVREALERGDGKTARELMDETMLSSIIDADLPEKELMERVQERENYILATAKGMEKEIKDMRRELRAIPARSPEAILSDMKRARKDLEHRREVLREVQEDARPFESAQLMLREGRDVGTVQDYLDDNDVLVDLDLESDDPNEFRDEVNHIANARRGAVEQQRGYCTAAQKNLDMLKVEEKKGRLGADKVDDTPMHPAQVEQLNELQLDVIKGKIYEGAMKAREANEDYRRGLQAGQSLAREATISYNRNSYGTQDTLNTISDRLGRDVEVHRADVKAQGKRPREEVLEGNGTLEALEITKRRVDAIRDIVAAGNKFI